MPQCHVALRLSAATREDIRATQDRFPHPDDWRPDRRLKSAPALFGFPSPEALRRQKQLPPQPGVSWLLSSIPPCPSIPALWNTHRKLRKNSTCGSLRSASRSDDAGKFSLRRSSESRDTAARLVASPLDRSTAPRNMSATPHRASARAKCNPPAHRRGQRGLLPGNTARSISANTKITRHAPPPC